MIARPAAAKISSSPGASGGGFFRTSMPARALRTVSAVRSLSSIRACSLSHDRGCGPQIAPSAYAAVAPTASATGKARNKLVRLANFVDPRHLDRLENLLAAAARVV